MGTFVVILVILAIVGVIVWQVTESKNALASFSAQSRHDPRHTAEIVNNAFDGTRGMLWSNVDGPGTINKRRRGKDGGIVMSIDISSSGAGSRVDMWASSSNVYLHVIVNFAGVVNRRKKAIAQAIA